MSTFQTPTRDDFLNLFMDFAGQANTIHIPKAYLALCDFDFPAAALLSQILYWMPRTKNKDGWVIKSYAEWFGEICLTEYQIRRATAKLKKMGLKTILKRSGIHKGAPTVHYRMEKEAFTDCIMKFLNNRETKDSHSEVSKGSHSEETQETFTKISTKILQREKESPADPIGQTPVVSDSPIGDSLSGDDPVTKGAALIENAFAVKAEDADSQPADSKTTEKLLPPPRETNAAAAPAVKSDSLSKKVHARKPLMDAVCYALNEPAGPFPGKVGAFFLGQLKKKKGDLWAEHQPDPSPTPELIPQQIIAFTLWYSHHDKYKASFAEHKSMPHTPSLLREHWDKYMARPQNVHDHWMAKAKPVLERLLRGEQVHADTSGAGPVESAQSFKRFDPKAADPYTVRTDPDDEPETEDTPVGAFS